MPLYDHFHGPVARRPWTSFHGQWAHVIAADLNRRLPNRFVADAMVKLGTSVEADVVEWRADPIPGRNGDSGPFLGSGGGVAVAPEQRATTDPLLYTPPETAVQMPGEFPDDLLVVVKDTRDGMQVIGVVEIASPANKKERYERERFVAKSMSYLNRGIGLVLLDIVTESRRNLHDELVGIAGYDPKFEFPEPSFIYAVSYRPVRRAEQNLIDLWRWPLAVGAALPAVPLPLTGYGCVRLDLEATYTEACERCRIP